MMQESGPRESTDDIDTGHRQVDPSGDDHDRRADRHDAKNEVFFATVSNDPR